jgi:hypothetical protein
MRDREQFLNEIINLAVQNSTSGFRKQPLLHGKGISPHSPSPISIIRTPRSRLPITVFMQIRNTRRTSLSEIEADMRQGG